MKSLLCVVSTIAATVLSKSACLRQCKHRTTDGGNSHRNVAIQTPACEKAASGADLHVSTAWNF